MELAGPVATLAWLALWCLLMAIVPFVTSAFGGLAGFGVLMLAVALAFWRLERFCARQYWQGLREYKLLSTVSRAARPVIPAFSNGS